MAQTISRDELVAKIKNSLFLKEETKERLISILDQLTEEDKAGLVQTLEEGEQKEREMLTFLIEKDPEFPQKLKKFMQDQVKTAFREQEQKERKQDENEENTLLEELNSI